MSETTPKPDNSASDSKPKSAILLRAEEFDAERMQLLDELIVDGKLPKFSDDPIVQKLLRVHVLNEAIENIRWTAETMNKEFKQQKAVQDFQDHLNQMQFEPTYTISEASTYNWWYGAMDQYTGVELEDIEPQLNDILSAYLK